MHPEICKIGPFTVYSYGLMLAVAFFVSAHLAAAQAKKHNFNPQIIFNFAFLVFLSGILGTRLFYIIENIGYYLESPDEIIMLQHGGLSWFGGLVLATLCGIVYLKKKKLPIYKILDLVVPFLALAQGLGRIGCFLNGCCFGELLGIPTQIISSLILVVIFIILRLLQERPHRRGEIFYSYLLLYSLKRFFIEFWRFDNPAVFLGLTLFQIISIGVFCFSLVGFISKIAP